MLAFIVRRLLFAVLTIWVISVLSFAIIQLPPGDFVTAYIAQASASGASVSAQEAAALRELYGIGKPFHIQYAKRSEEHTSELQSHSDLVCRLLLEKKKKK